MKIAVIGDGGWGTANAMLLCGNGHDVTLWGAFPEYVEEMRRTRRNEKFLKGVELPASLKETGKGGLATSESAKRICECTGICPGA